MGCSNVACSVSHISIQRKDPVVFIPLIPKKIVTSVKMFSTSEMYIPAFLPIFGEYDDYGSLQNIAKDYNTDMIEQEFGISIQEFVNIIAEEEEVFGSSDEIHNAFKIQIFNNQLNPDTIRDMCFEEISIIKDDDKIFQSVKNDHCGLVLHLEYILKERFINRVNVQAIKNDNEEELCVYFSIYNPNYKGCKELQHEIWNNLGIAIGNDINIVQKADFVSKLSGMFVHKDIYDELSSVPSEKMTQRIFFDKLATIEILYHIGFTTVKEFESGYGLSNDQGICFKINSQGFCCDEETRQYLYHISNVFDFLKKNHKINLDAYEISKKVSLNSDFNALVDIKNQLAEKLNLIEDKMKDGDRSYELSRKSFAYRDSSVENILTRQAMYKDWLAFCDFYKPHILNDISIFKFLKDFSVFTHRMQICNIHFSPALNGEQHGNDQWTKKLLKKSLQIVNNRGKE